MDSPLSRRRLLRAMPVLLAAIALAGCDSSTAPPARIELDAQVQMLVLDGPNAWLLRSLDSNTAYYPLNLPREFQVEELRVRVDGLLIREYRVLLHQPIEILAISEIED